MKIIIEATSQRAKNRVNEHGEVMEVLAGQVNNGIATILVESLNKTWRGETWKGWFTENEIKFNAEIKSLFRNLS